MLYRISTGSTGFYIDAKRLASKSGSVDWRSRLVV